MTDTAQKGVDDPKEKELKEQAEARALFSPVMEKRTTEYVCK
jgi:hypothetical protein